MDNTIIQQGMFVSTGVDVLLNLRSDVDWINVKNYTEFAATNNGHGYEYFWQRGIPIDYGFMYYHPAADHTSAVDIITTGGFRLINSSVQTPGAPVATTASSNAAQPVISTGATAGLVDDTTIVRLCSIAAAPNICGVDFTVDTVVANTSFITGATLANVPGAVGGAGTYRIVARNLSEYRMFYPNNRTICNITAAASAVVSTTVYPQYAIGEKVRFTVPASSGMVEMNGLIGTVTAITATTFTVDIDSTLFTAFTWPSIASIPTTFASVVPVGEDTSAALFAGTDILSDSTRDQSVLGILLYAGITSPAGSQGDHIKWVAGKSFNL